MTYHAFYTPYDDPDTEDVDESENLKFLKTIHWDGKGSQFDFPKFSVSSYLGSQGNGRVVLFKVEIEKVSFSGAKYHELKSDNTRTTYSAPHWVDRNGDGDANDSWDKNYPVAFTRNTKPKIGAQFKLDTSLNRRSVKIKATGPGGVAIPETNATISDGTVILHQTQSTGAFVNSIKFYNAQEEGKEFELTWQMAIGGSWFDVGKTKHTVYLTLDDPAPMKDFHGNAIKLRQESLFWISCKNADGLKNKSAATDAIWSEFTDLEVVRKDETQLTYYANYMCSNTDASSLLESADGQCGAWTVLFIRLRQIHGMKLKIY